MDNQIEIYKTTNNQTEINVQFDTDTVWLNQKQMAMLFQTTVANINMHMKSIFEDGELSKDSTIKDFLIVQKEGRRNVTRQQNFYNLDAIISVGYRIKSQVTTQFRQWATQRLKDYLVQGYAINEKRLAQKQQEVEYLKTGIRILNRAIGQQVTVEDSTVLKVFAQGLSLLDAYDHQQLDKKGKTLTEAIYPDLNNYMQLIHTMYNNVKSDVFAKPKDDSFNSSINQIGQCFDGTELYPTIQFKRNSNYQQ